MGKGSRDKGGRVERLLRDHLAALGFQSGRIPLSGAMSGFPGDVYAIDDEFGRVLFECKSRAKGFEDVYELLDKFPVGHVLKVRHDDSDLGEALVSISYDVKRVLRSDQDAFSRIEAQKLSKKIVGMRRWLGRCDILAIKKDRKAFLFLRFR